MAGLAHAVICLTAAGLVVVIQWQASVRGYQRLVTASSKSGIRWI